MSITYRTAREEDAEAIVAFYNEVGGETSYLSFEKDEYPMNEEEQREEIRSLKDNQTNIMLMAMDGEKMQELPPFIPATKSNPGTRENLALSLQKHIRDRGLEQN